MLLFEAMFLNGRLNLDTILPGVSIAYPVAMQGEPLPTGTFRAALTLTFGQHRTLNYTTTISVTRQGPSAALGLAALSAANSCPAWLAVTLALLAA